MESVNQQPSWYVDSVQSDMLLRAWFTAHLIRSLYSFMLTSPQILCSMFCSQCVQFTSEIAQTVDISVEHVEENLVQVPSNDRSEMTIPVPSSYEVDWESHITSRMACTIHCVHTFQEFESLSHNRHTNNMIVYLRNSFWKLIWISVLCLNNKFIYIWTVCVNKNGVNSTCTRLSSKIIAQNGEKRFRCNHIWMEHMITVRDCQPQITTNRSIYRTTYTPNACVRFMCLCCWIWIVR